MKRDQLTKYHTQSKAEIMAEVTKLEAGLLMKRMELANNKVKNLHVIKTTRQDIAKLKTILRELELATPAIPAPKVTPKAAVEKKVAKKTTKAEAPKKTVEKTVKVKSTTRGGSTKTKK